MDENPTEGKMFYQIKVKGKLDESWSHCFEGFQIQFCDQDTIISGPVADQVALRAMLEALWDLNLTVISLGQA